MLPMLCNNFFKKPSCLHIVKHKNGVVTENTHLPWVNNRKCFVEPPVFMFGVYISFQFGQINP